MFLKLQCIHISLVCVARFKFQKVNSNFRLFALTRGEGGFVGYVPEHIGKKSKWRSKVCVKLTPLMTFSHKQSLNGFKNALFIWHS